MSKIRKSRYKSCSFFAKKYHLIISFFIFFILPWKRGRGDRQLDKSIFLRAMPELCPAQLRCAAVDAGGDYYGGAFQFATYLAIDPVDLPVLILELAAHVDRHVPQVADHRVHLAHVLLHLPLARVVRDLGDVAALGPDAVAVVHHPLGLVVDDLAVVVALPRALVLLKAGASARARSRERRDLSSRKRKTLSTNVV